MSKKLVTDLPDDPRLRAKLDSIVEGVICAKFDSSKTIVRFWYQQDHFLFQYAVEEFSAMLKDDGVNEVISTIHLQAESKLGKDLRAVKFEFEEGILDFEEEDHG